MQKWLSKIKYTQDKNYGAVMAFLNYKNPFIKRAAVSALAESGSRRIAKQFLKMYSFEAGLQTRLSLLDALGKLKIKLPTAVIHRRIANKKMPMPASELKVGYRTLGKIGGIDEVTFLVSQFRNFKRNYPKFMKYEKEMKQELIYAIGHVGGSAALNFFKQAVKGDNDLSKYKRALIKAASSIKVAGVDSLVIALSRGNDLVNDQTISTLSIIGVSKANISYVVKKARKMFNEGQDIYLLLKALEKHHYKNYRAFLKEVFGSDKLGFNSLTVVASILTKYVGVEFVPQIIKKLQKIKNLQVISIYVRLLGDLGSSDAVVVLKEYLQHDAPGISFLASEALQKITGKKFKSTQFEE